MRPYLGLTRFLFGVVLARFLSTRLLSGGPRDHTTMVSNPLSGALEPECRILVFRWPCRPHYLGMPGSVKLEVGTPGEGN